MKRNLSSQRFEGKTVFITGGGAGIGAATAERISSEGGNVIVMDLQGDKVHAQAEKCNGSAVVGDALNPSDLAKATKIADEKFGGLDGFVAAAGFEVYGAVDTIDLNDWQRVISINLDGALQGARAVLPLMKKKEAGAIVLLSSISGMSAGLQNAGYATAKAGLIGLSKSIAADNGPFNIRCNAVCPGVTYSELTARMFKVISEQIGVSEDEVIAKLTKPMPLGRIGNAGEVAAAITFLLSDDASYITATALPVDGGVVSIEAAMSHLVP